MWKEGERKDVENEVGEGGKDKEKEEEKEQTSPESKKIRAHMSYWVVSNPHRGQCHRKRKNHTITHLMLMYWCSQDEECMALVFIKMVL